MVEDDVLGRNVNDFSLPATRFGSDNPDIDTLIGFDPCGQSAADEVSHPCDRKSGLPSLVRGSVLLRLRFDLEPGDWIENLTALEYDGQQWSMYKYEEDEFINKNKTPVIPLRHKLQNTAVIG